MTKSTLSQWVRIAIPAFLLASLAACGGGSGYGGGGGGGTTYTVGGMVTGLTGSGLVLQNNGGSDLAVSAPGAFTFNPGLTSGAAYAVTVKTQPSSPAQNCVVTNGSGMVSYNVTNVAVDCTGIVSGPFIGVDYGTSGDDASLGVTTLDGAGNFSSTSTENNAGTVVAGTIDSGTYTVLSGGAVIINFNNGAVSLDGNVIVSADMNLGEQAYIDIEVKQGQTTFTNADVVGTYQLVTYGNSGDSGTLWALTADGSGNFIGSEIQNNAGVISSSSAITGTYAVAADGALTLSPAVGAALTGGVSADGNTLVVSQLTAGQGPSITVGIKQSQSGLTNADLSGTYAIATQQKSGDAGSLWAITFDGAGNINGTGTSNDGVKISNVAVTGTYSIAPDGALTVSPTGADPLIGSISGNGQELVLTNLNAGDAPSLWFGVHSALFSPWDY